MEGLTLLDVQKRLSPDQTTALKVAELLNKSTPLMQDAPWIGTNKTDTRTTNVRAGLPKPLRRLANQGARISKSVVTQIEEATTSFEDYAESDVMVIDSFGVASAEARAMEATAHIEGMAQEFTKALIMDNKNEDPSHIMGLHARYGSLDIATNPQAQNVISAGPAVGAGADNASIYLIKWHPAKVACIYPKRAMGMSQGAVEHEAMGTPVVESTDADGNQRRLKVYRDRFAISGGLCIADWRCVVRICNIDVSGLMGRAAATAGTVRRAMIKALHRIPNGDGMMRFYMNRTVAQYLDIERLDAVQSAGMTYMDVDGKVMPSFRGVPIRVEDSLLDTEARVV